MNRTPGGYDKRWDIPWKVGAQGEMFVADIINLIRDGTGGIEVKRDTQWQLTRRVYVEYECQYQGGWGASGLQTTAAQVWAFVIGDPPAAYMYPTDFLKRVCDPHWSGGAGRLVRECCDSDHPTRGVAIPLHMLADELRRISNIARETAS